VGDFGDVAGRRPAFILAATIYIIANLGLALQDNYAALLILRMVQSAGSSGTLALGYAVVADVSVSAERGKYMGIVGAGINVGPALGPVLGGILAQYLGWRSIFWFCLIYCAAGMIPYILTVPETSRQVVGNGSIPPPKWNMTLLDYIKSRRQRGKQGEASTSTTAANPPVTKRKLKFPNPFHALLVVVEKDVGMLIFYNSMLYLVFMMVIATLSTQYTAIYGLDNLQTGLCYLPYGAGCFCASIGQGWVLDWNYRRIARKIGFSIDYLKGDDLSQFPIEKARLQPVIPMALIGIVVTIVYGWLLEIQASLAGPLVLLFVIGLCITGSFSILSTLVVDLYPEAPATAVAATNLVRCMFGALCTALVEQMIQRMGRGWTHTFWSLICLLFFPIIFVLIKKGPQWREERRLKQLKKKKEKEESEKSDE
jgi:multidrug resistance protein